MSSAEKHQTRVTERDEVQETKVVWDCLFHFSPNQFQEFKNTRRLRMVSEILELQYVDLPLLEAAVSGLIAWVRR